ncbi:hypothetical protein APHAL10511_004713 [Amanita phalloides]|nr:hypothetical protein APHAL10511_004713 [Amanita phalloides]
MALAAFANVPDSSDTVSFDISDDESDCDRGYAQTSVCTLLVIQQRTKGSAYPNAVEEPLRRIAGTRRVSNYRERTGLAPAEAVSGTSFQLLQSITAIPALADRSFEEIRLECYSQSAIATGRPPQAANTSLNPIGPGGNYAGCMKTIV